MAPEPQRERPVVHVVPAGVGLDQLGFRHHVAVEEHEHLAGGRSSAHVACPRQAEAVVHLGHHPGLKGRTGRNRDGWAGTVVGHNHLEQVQRVGLGRQPGKGQVKSLLALVAGQHHGDTQGRPPVAQRRHVQDAPVVATHDPGQPVALASRPPVCIHVSHQPTTWRARSAPVTTP